jgi:CubicO group peptidase (beta-lactamase class C family)
LYLASHWLPENQLTTILTDMRILSASLLLILILTGCDDVHAVDSIKAPPILDDGWPVASLTESGFDIEKMIRIDKRLEAGGYTNVHMVAVEYDGRLVYEKYLSGKDESWGSPADHREFNQDSLHDLRSVSKSVTALMLGIALGDDFEAALAKPIVEYFPEFADEMPAGAENITLHHALTMSTGLEWNEMDVPYSKPGNDARQLYSALDPIEQVLTKPMRDKPGKDWYYNGGATMVLAALVAKLSGQEFLAFSEENLTKPLGIKPSGVEWRGLGIWKRRLPSAASGLRLRLRDLAKIGSLMLHQGRWQGKQVVPALWVEASSQRHMEQTYRKWSMGGVYGYGYQWWHGNFEGAWGKFTSITGVGLGGQRVFVISEKKLAITVFAGNYSTGIWKMSEHVASRIVDAAPK